MNNTDMADRDSNTFKRCPMCSFRWETRDSFLEDPDIDLVGYQISFEDLVAGHFLFNHTCKGTLGILMCIVADSFSFSKVLDVSKQQDLKSNPKY